MSLQNKWKQVLWCQVIYTHNLILEKSMALIKSTLYSFRADFTHTNILLLLLELPMPFLGSWRIFNAAFAFLPKLFTNDKNIQERLNTS